MTYPQTLKYLFKALPAYHRVGTAAYKANLDNTLAMMDYLNHPERELRVIHVAGTNGKGSVSHYLAAILHRAGYKVGLYTSPHLVDFRERIRIDGEMITKKAVVSFVEQHRRFFEQQGLSFFEMTVGLAFDYFRERQVDVAVIEVGMGGRLDSTNVVTPELSIITNIGFDHTQFLGSTLGTIAGEKAGIIKEGVPVIIGETHAETAPVFKAKAASMHADIQFADQHYEVQELRDDGVRMHADIFRDGELFLRGLRSQMDGLYQRKNLATVCAAWQMLRDLGYHIRTFDFREGVGHVVTDTGLRGRWEQLSRQPRIVCETAHNADGIASLVKKLDMMPYDEPRIIYGCVNDKDYGAILDMLPKHARYFYTRPSVERGLDEKVLAKTASAHGREGEVFPDVMTALAAARKVSRANDLIVVTGSIFLVADLLEGWEKRR